MRIKTAARRFGRHMRRFRYARKARMVWGRKASLHASSPAAATRYVLWHPELDTFSIRLANADEVLEGLAKALSIPACTLAGFAAELLFDEAITARLPHHMVYRNRHDGRRTENLLGRQVPKYVVARALKPRMIVETGVKDGYGSMALLRALEHNRSEGAHGELVSFDLNPIAGRAVPDHLMANWEFVPRPSAVMSHFLNGRQVDFLVSDSSPDYACVAAEVQTALSAGAPRIVVLGNAAWNPAIRDAEYVGYAKSLHACCLTPDNTLYGPQAIDVAVFHRTEAAS